MGTSKMSMNQRVTAIMRGEKPDRIPFIDRMEFWHGHHLYSDTLPERFQGLSLTRIHEKVGLGREVFAPAFAYRLHGVRLTATFQGETIYDEKDPVYPWFPALEAPDFVRRDLPGVTRLVFSTARGQLTMSYMVSAEMVAMGGVTPYLQEHLLKDEADWPAVKTIMEKTEFVPLFDELYAQAEEIGSHGYVIPFTNRAPFQQILLEHMGEVPVFTAIYENPNLLENLMQLLDETTCRDLHCLADLDLPYVEFCENLDGMMTNPNLFKQYSIPYYQKYADILHGQGKKMGAHTDGNLKPLLDLLPESGLDVVESVSPAPLTPPSFDDIWAAFNNGPTIWGAVPSPLLEPEYPESQLHDYIHHLLDLVGDKPFILGVGDMVIGPNLIERVEWIAETVENHLPR